jgi:V8-like Glu-specific endopeptidase
MLDDQSIEELDGALPDSDHVAHEERSIPGHAMEDDDELVDATDLTADVLPVAPMGDDAASEDSKHDPEGTESLSQELIFPGSALSLVSNAKGSPQRTNVQLAVRWKTGEHKVCSGTLITPDAVLTAAHCVFNSTRGGFAAAITVEPGAQSGEMPIDRVGAKRSFCPGSYRAVPNEHYEGYPFDYAVVRLKRGLSVGTRSLAEGSRALHKSFVVRGYPAVKHHPVYRGHDMYESRGTIRTTRSDGVFYHYASTLGGMSGGGIDNGSHIIGVHTSGAESANSGVVFSAATIATIQDWATRPL